MPATLAPEYYVSTSYASLSGIMKLRISERERERQRGEKRWEGETERVTGSFEMQSLLFYCCLVYQNKHCMLPVTLRQSMCKCFPGERVSVLINALLLLSGTDILLHSLC